MFEPIKALSENQIERLQQATEEILEVVGFQVTNAEPRRRERVAGAIVDDARQRLRLPATLLRELLARIPPQYLITDLDGRD